MFKNLQVGTKFLHTPELEEVADVLKTGLKSNFKEVTVEVVDCPNLKEQPFTLACEGLCGNPKLIEVGGPSYLLPLVQRDKVYDVRKILDKVGSDPAFIIGAGCGPFTYAGVNCEGMFNFWLDDDTIDQHTRIARVNPLDGSVIQERLPNSETTFALLANLFYSQGQPGKVLKVHVKVRKGSDDFIASIRKALAAHYKNQTVGLGGTFLLKEGKAKQHVMPEFSKTPIKSDEEVNKWLKFYNMSAPLIAVGTLVTRDFDLDLRLQHFHSFSHHGEGGHYHIDTTPETVEYLGYFNVAEEIYRIDRPINGNQLGRD